MAFHLGRSVQEVRATVTSSEFVKWVWYLDWMDTQEFHREDFYLAQIAFLIERGQVKHPKKVKLEDKLLKFKAKKLSDNVEEKMERSKSFWKMMTGLGSKLLNARKRKLPSKVKQSTKNKKE